MKILDFQYTDVDFKKYMQKYLYQMIMRNVALRYIYELKDRFLFVKIYIQNESRILFNSIDDIFITLYVFRQDPIVSGCPQLLL